MFNHQDIDSHSFTSLQFQNDLSEQQFEQPLDAHFFKQLSQLQKSYENDKSQVVMGQLLAKYTDCVSYFEIIQEPVSSYFQLKIKQLLKHIQFFGSPEQAKKNKEKLEKEVVKVLQSQSVQKTLHAEEKRHQNRLEKERQSIRLQQQKLMSRIRKSKRSMTKSQSVTFSYGSINSSPEIGSKIRQQIQDKQIMQLKSTKKFLFHKEINSSDDQQNTVG